MGLRTGHDCYDLIAFLKQKSINPHDFYISSVTITYPQIQVTQLHRENNRGI